MTTSMAVTSRHWPLRGPAGRDLMGTMRHWVGIISEQQFAIERLYARDVIGIAARPDDAEAAEKGDPVVLVAAGRPTVLFGHGIIRGRSDEGGVLVEYQVRIFDDPRPVPADVTPTPAGVGLHSLPTAQFTRLSTLVDATVEASAGRSVWFVSVSLPIEASTRAEAVREFWTYVDKLGPMELPAYVWPLGDELDMQAFVQGAVANLDPEEDG